MKIRYLVIVIVLLLIFKFVSTIDAINNSTQHISIRYNQSPSQATLFPIQCIDTMKVSRDRAQEKMPLPEQKAAIRKRVSLIASIGANCIAIGTPYNDEFVPYLRLWVEEARRHHLHVWFRGNWSEWEGWFNYPKKMSVKEHTSKTVHFITAHPELFEDGDIFTSAPEAENGGPFHPVDTHDKIVLYRQFLIDQHTQAAKAFSAIGKRVTTNWLSMSGGVAKGTLDLGTVNDLGNIVTLDHYVNSANGMSEYISFFSDQFNADIVLGEFGAPIPDINGTMTEKEQAEFVNSLLDAIYKEGTVIKGINYWTLSESSTALLNSQGKEKEVVAVLKKYYLPGVVTGKIKDTEGGIVNNLSVRTADSSRRVMLNGHGQFTFTVPAKTTTFVIDETKKYEGKKFSVDLQPGQSAHADITLRPQKNHLLYQIKSYIRDVVK